MKYNILVLLMDTVRPDHLSCYGYERETTPFIDLIAERSQVFDSTYSSSIWTVPAYGTLFTGKLPHEHGAITWRDEIDENRLVKGLNQAGYQTRAVSPHYLTGENGAVAAFDEVTNVSVDHRDLLFDDDPVFEWAKKISRGTGWHSKAAMAADLVKKVASERSLRTVPNGAFYIYQHLRNELGFWGDNGAQDVLRKTAKIIDAGPEPYFLFANFIEPHEPYRPPRRWARTFADDVSLNQINNVLDIDLGSLVAGKEISTDEQQLLIDLYDAELRYLDRMLEKYLSPKIEKGLFDDTIVVLLSDHGEAFGEWGLWGHQGRIHNKIANVPLIVSHPDDDGGRSSEVAGLRDLTQYLVDVAMADENDVPLPETLPSGEAFIEYYGWDSQKLNPPWVTYDTIDQSDWDQYQASYVCGDYKLFWDSDDDIALSNYESDPREEVDISEKRATLVTEYQERIEEEIGVPEDVYARFRRSESSTGISSDVSSRLEQLGYK